MADEPAEKPAAPAADAPKKSSLLPVLLGIIVVLAIGIGGGLFLAGMLSGSDDEKPKVDPGASNAIDIKTTKEISIGDLITNVANQDGRRYVKLTCVVWMGAKDAASVTGSGGDGEIQVKRLMQMALEEQLKRYELADLTGRGIIAALTQDFTVVLEDVLHAQFPDRAKDHRFIRRVLLNNLLVQ